MSGRGRGRANEVRDGLNRTARGRVVQRRSDWLNTAVVNRQCPGRGDERWATGLTGSEQVT